MPRNPYRYRSLEHDKSIRLLKLLPGGANKKIQCHLITANADDCPPYEAISYVWGNQKDRTRVLCHGKLLKIPTNLFHALQRFRQKAAPRILWADSICINQRDLVERRKQVRIMGTIFESARRVLVWLGRDHYSDAKPSFDLTRAMAPLCIDLQYPLTEEQESNFASRIEQFPSAQLDSFKYFLSNSWFSRIWVLQEISLAQEGQITWGDEEVTWYELCVIIKALRWAGQGSPRTEKLFGSKLSVITSVDFRRLVPTFELLDQTRRFQCSDPRDKIYALLAHTSFQDERKASKSRYPIPVDYSLPYSEIYLAAANRLMEDTRYGPLSVLSLVGHNSETINNMEITSWVPQWNAEYKGVVLVIGPQLYSASGSIAPQYLLTGHILQVEGLLYDSIKWQSEVLEAEHFDLMAETSSDVFRDIWKELGRLEEGMLTEEEILQKLCLTMNAGNAIRRGSTYRAALPKEKRIADCIAFFNEAGIALDSQEKLKGMFGPGSRFRFVETTSKCLERRLFVTERGHYGLGPEVTFKGDKISILFGAEVPFVLWPQKTGGFRLCGECYVSGIMNGEAIEMWKNGELEQQSFVLT